MRWDGHVVRMGEGRGVYKVLIGVSVICTRSGYEVPGMILLEAYLCTYSFMIGVTF